MSKYWFSFHLHCASEWNFWRAADIAQLGKCTLSILQPRPSSILSTTKRRNREKKRHSLANGFKAMRKLKLNLSFSDHIGSK
jgi:hypothetical protein